MVHIKRLFMLIIVVFALRTDDYILEDVQDIENEDMFNLRLIEAFNAGNYHQLTKILVCHVDKRNMRSALPAVLQNLDADAHAELNLLFLAFRDSASAQVMTTLWENPFGIHIPFDAQNHYGFGYLADSIFNFDIDNLK